MSTQREVWTAAIALGCLLTAVGCGSRRTEDPCDGVTCSGHGTCYVADGEAQCDCDTGYYDEGLECFEHITADSDVDSDVDGDVDSDGDGDGDSDVDGDVDEEGDADGDGPPPVDSDGDRLPDVLEDLDGDGTLDPGETDPTDPDTDDDGWSDLIEVAVGTDPQDEHSHLGVDGDIAFVVPHMEDPDPADGRLAYLPIVEDVDVYFLADNTGSMYDDITTIRDNLLDIIETIECGVGEHPAFDECFARVESGIGQFGSGSWSHLKDIDADHAATVAAFPTSTGSADEHPIQAMDGVTGGTCASSADRIGRACFRPDALSLLVLATDEDFREDPWYGSTAQQSAYDRMADRGIRVVGATCGGGELATLREDLLAMEDSSGLVELVPSVTGTVASTECSALGASPFHAGRAIVDGPGALADDAIACTVQSTARHMAHDQAGVMVNDPENRDADGSAVDAVSLFVDHLETFQDGSAICTAGHATRDGDADGYPEIYDDLLPALPVCWQITPLRNETIEGASDRPLAFRVTVDVRGEGGALMGTHDVYFVVPPLME